MGPQMAIAKTLSVAGRAGEGVPQPNAHPPNSQPSKGVNFKLPLSLVSLDSPFLLPTTKLSYLMSGYRCFTCPVEFNNDSNSFTVDCEPSELFQLQEYNIPLVIQSVIRWVGL